jgi:hypothetical protein
LLASGRTQSIADGRRERSCEPGMARVVEVMLVAQVEGKITHEGLVGKVDKEHRPLASAARILGKDLNSPIQLLILGHELRAARADKWSDRRAQVHARTSWQGRMELLTKVGEALCGGRRRPPPIEVIRATKVDYRGGLPFSA